MRPIDVDELINNINAAHKAFAKLLAEQPTIEQPQWISCAERLPKSRMAVLGVLWRDTVDIVWYDKDDGVWQSEFCNAYAEGEVTHWMPLPMPPKGDE